MAAPHRNDDPLRSEMRGPALWLTLDRPEQRNALSLDLMAAMQDALDRAGEAPSVRVIVLAANGPAFCAGHDLREMRADPSRAAQERIFAACGALMLTIARMAQPVIARVHGVATAAGCQLVAASDLAVASTEARFATPGVNIGLFCSTPMVALSRAVPRKQAMEMLLTGDMIDAETAARIGLINQAVPADTLDQSVNRYVEAIAAKSPYTIGLGKRAFYRQIDLPLPEAYDFAARTMVENMLADDAKEGIDAFLEKRPPRWTGR